MRRNLPHMRPFLFVNILGFSLALAAERDNYWPQWRGPDANGVSRTATPPVEWSETKNIKWKAGIPGRGSSSPVVWADRIYVQTAVPLGVAAEASHQPRGAASPRGPHVFKVMALNRADGKIVWERNAREQEPHEPAHFENGTWASGSPITDGQHVIAYFESFGIYCYDMSGKLIWEKDLGDKKMRNQFGEGSTPVLHGDTIVVVWDHIGGQSFVVALDKRTGNELWRVNRDEIDTWATPLVVETEGRPQVIVPGRKRLISYDLASGKVVWETAGLTMNPIPSPVYGNGVVFAMSGFQGNMLKAIKIAGASGDITETGHVLWSLNRDTPYVPSPLLYDGVLYFLKTNNGLLSAFDAQSGKPHYQLQRLEHAANVFSSPVGAAGRVYIAGRDGTTVVVRHGPAFEVLAENTLDDGFDASPALAGRDLYLRGYKHLYAITH